MRRALAAALLLAGLAGVPAQAAPKNVVVTDGFTASAVAGAQAVVHLAHATPPPGPLGSGPPVDLSVSTGPIAGFALVAMRGNAYAAVVEATQQHTCGRADCGPDAYTRDAVSWTGTTDNRLPAGDYRLVLIGARGARVTATLRSSTKRHAPVRVPLVASRYRLDVSPTVTTTPGVAGAQPTDRGSYHHNQSAHRALVGVVHTVEIQYGSSVDYTLCAGRTATSGECGGTHRVGSEELTNNDPAMPLDMAVTPMYATHVLLVPSDDVEADVGGSWQATVYAGRATQRGLGVYVPLEIG